MFWRWRSLWKSDFVEEQTEFGGRWRYGGAKEGWHQEEKYPTQNARDSSKSGYLLPLLIADTLLFAGGFTLAGTVGMLLVGGVTWSGESDKRKMAEREAEIQRGLDRSFRSSVWKVEPEHDFAMRVRDNTPGYDTKGSGRLHRLLKAWLADCDEHHDCSHPEPSFTPLRLIDTKPDGRSTNRLVLVEHLRCPDYIVLSHCWGNLTANEKNRFNTNINNIDQRLEGFNLTDLPLSFQDAVAVTRAIGKRYLWIDSVCLIQPREPASKMGGNARSHKDMAAGMKLMDQVFASAYCTIAASSAENSKQGFLSGHQVPNAQGLCADFEQDVNQSPLSQRAWVLQERVLSRRTIHFTSNHLYWECGELARCDDYNKLTTAPGKDYFVQDSHFPERLSSAGIPRVVGFLMWFINGFSRRGITKPYDRYSAISGLITRMKAHDVFGKHGEYGIFDWCLARQLLWRRADGSSESPIDYTEIDVKSVPSWSWMAYPGEVEFMAGENVKLNVAVGTDLDLVMSSCGPRLVVNLRSLVDCPTIACLAGRLTPLTSESGTYIGEIWADQKVDARIESCVVVGYDKGKVWSLDTMVYVIFVQEAGVEGKLTRLGVGTMKASSIYGSGTRRVLH